MSVRLAAKPRFRPIVMTAPCTLAGMVPMAVGIGGASCENLQRFAFARRQSGRPRDC